MRERGRASWAGRAAAGTAGIRSAGVAARRFAARPLAAAAALCLAALLASAAAAALAQSFVVPAELWDRPRSAEAIRATAAIRQAVAAHLARPETRLLLRHAPGQQAALAAEELRSWLIALAIEPAAIALRGDLAPAEPIRIEVVEAKR